MENTQQNNNGKDAGYTKDEVEFADGKGTQLDEKTELPNKDKNTENAENVENAEKTDGKDKNGGGNSESGTSEGDADFENPDDDPA